MIMDDMRLSELYDVSKAARDMRSQLASSLQQAQTAHKYGSLKESMRKSRFLVGQTITFRHQLTKFHFLRSQISCQSNDYYPGTIGYSGAFLFSSSYFSCLCIGTSVQIVHFIETLTSVVVVCPGSIRDIIFSPRTLTHSTLTSTFTRTSRNTTTTLTCLRFCAAVRRSLPTPNVWVLEAQ